MFNTLRFLSKHPSSAVARLLRRPTVAIVPSAVESHAIRAVRCFQCRRQRPILGVDAFRLPEYSSKRYKRTRKQDDDGSDSDNDLEMDDSSRLIRFRTSTLRMDAVLKQALGKSRNKIEVAFYESRIRVNGEKVSKKSHTLQVGDEVDLVKGPSPNNPDFLLVSRVEVLSAKLDGDELEVKLKRYKSLLIDNYDNSWKAPSS